MLSAPAAMLAAVAAPLPVLAQEGGGGGTSLLFLVVAFAAMYLLLIRPQQKRARAQRELVSSVGVGDRIVTIGGIHGVIQSLDDDTIVLEVAPGITITMTRSAVGRRVVDETPGIDEHPGVGDED